MTEAEQAMLVRAEAALKKCYIAALTVKPSLDAPYSDDPRWTPWTRWVERPAKEAHDVATAIRAMLRETAVSPDPDQPESASVGPEGADR